MAVKYIRPGMRCINNTNKEMDYIIVFVVGPNKTHLVGWCTQSIKERIYKLQFSLLVSEKETSLTLTNTCLLS